MEANTVGIFVFAFFLSACAGVAALLRLQKEINIINLANYALNSGMIGLCLSLVFYFKYKENVYFLIGLCILAGLGGPATVDFLLKIAKKNLHQISKDENDNNPNS